MAAQLGASDNVVDNINSDFSKWQVSQLKKYLQDSGISCPDHPKKCFDAVVHKKVMNYICMLLKRQTHIMNLCNTDKLCL